MCVLRSGVPETDSGAIGGVPQHPEGGGGGGGGGAFGGNCGLSVSTTSAEDGSLVRELENFEIELVGLEEFMEDDDGQEGVGEVVNLLLLSLPLLTGDPVGE